MPAAASGRGRSSAARLRVFVTDGQGRAVRSAGLGRWLARVAPARARGSLTIALVSDTRMRALNRRYRGRDYPADVLSFACGPAEGSSQAPAAPHLGDIVIARGVAERQARSAGHPGTDELRILALHGLLHLLGYDHERDSGEMARLERKLRQKGGLSEALTERR